MNTRRDILSHWVFLLGIALCIPAILLAAIMVAWVITPIVVLYVTGMCAVWAMTRLVSGRPSEALADRLTPEAVLADIERDFELLEEVPVASAASAALPAIITATNVRGACPLGLRSGDVWSVGVNGHLSKPVCRPAADAFNSLICMSLGCDPDMAFSCVCPKGDHEVTFAVQASAKIPA